MNPYRKPTELDLYWYKKGVERDLKRKMTLKDYGAVITIHIPRHRDRGQRQ